jgi:multisubunit Na+/H+ antiporter MnhB subunit
MSIIFDVGLAVLVLGVAAWTVIARSAFAAVVGFVSYGLLLALAWVRLEAVDVALTEAAIGSGVTGAVLIVAAARLRPTEAAVSGRSGPGLRIAAGVLSALVACGLAGLVLYPTNPAPSLAAAAGAHLTELDVGNPVTAVLMAYRGLDTLLEKIVLLLAVIGVWSLAPDRLWGGAPDAGGGARPGGALVLLGRLLPPVGIVVGIYILWVGAVAPGGAFQGGAILAAMWLLTMIAGLVAAPRIDSAWLRRALVVGPLVFVAIGFVGFALPGGFLSYPASFAKPVIIAIEVVLTLSIAAILVMLAAGPPADGERP